MQRIGDAVITEAATAVVRGATIALADLHFKSGGLNANVAKQSIDNVSEDIAKHAQKLQANIGESMFSECGQITEFLPDRHFKVSLEMKNGDLDAVFFHYIPRLIDQAATIDIVL